MPTDAERIATIKSNALARLQELSESPKPSYTIDGQSVSWAEYYKMLMAQVDWARQQESAETPFEFQTQVET